MKAYYFGKPDMKLVLWAFRIKARWPWTRFMLLPPLAIIFTVLGPLSWSLVKLGSLGHWLAFKLGIDSRERWE